MSPERWMPIQARQSGGRGRRTGELLYAGVTTVFDAGNRAEHILPLRADERAGKILSPRIFATGNLVTYPGSHGDRIAVRISGF